MFPDQDGTGEMLMTAQLFDCLFSDQDGKGKIVMTARLFDCLCIFRACAFLPVVWPAMLANILST